MLGTSKKKKVSKTVHKPAKKKNKSNITPKVDLIPEEEMNDESPLEYMPLSQKKEDEDKEEDDDIESDDFDEIDLSDNWLQSEKESEDFEDLDI